MAYKSKGVDGASQAGHVIRVRVCGDRAVCAAGRLGQLSVEPKPKRPAAKAAAAALRAKPQADSNTGTEPESEPESEPSEPESEPASDPDTPACSQGFTAVKDTVIDVYRGCDVREPTLAAHFDGHTPPNGKSCQCSVVCVQDVFCSANISLSLAVCNPVWARGCTES